MKHIQYLYIGALAFLIACNSEERITTTNGNRSSDAIELSAGIVEGNARATTRAGAEDNHDTPGHQTFSDNTKIALRVSGTWTEHTPSEEIVETTTASLNGVAEETGNRHNKLSSSPVLYWEDYGSSDIANMGTGKGREKGLTIYGAAVDGVASVPSGLISSGTTIDGTLGKWTGLSWTLDANQSSGFSAKDLLISNNISGDNGATYETDYGRYLFEKRNLGKLLEFKHTMSKITVNLKAGDGFAGYSFAEAYPVVYLTGNEGDPSDDYAWAYTTGTVNITTGAITGQGGLKYITMSQALTPNEDNNITKEALVMPGSLFKKPTGTAPNLVYPVIVRIKVDGNIYYVTSEKIRKAIDNSNYTSSTDFATEAGKNYVINIIVNQTGISVTATVANWTDISADNVAPEINLVGELGGEASNWGANKEFSFYRSEELNTGYNTSAKIGNYYPEESELSYTNSSHTWALNPILYWPDHNTHYQFRAVWPQTGTETGEQTYPRVEDGTGTTSGYQVIKVKNVAYSAGSFPSDLMIARPNVDNQNGNCGSRESDEVHPKKNLYTQGICARTGSINLTFNYMMSKVKVNLTTSKVGDQDYPATVNLNNAKVEIVNVYNNGDVKLGDREVIPTEAKGNYTLNNYSYNDGTKTATYSSAIVPQTFTYSSALASGNTKLRITIYNNGDTNSIDDIYEADLKPILVQEGTSAAAAVDGWESGKSYVYNLRLTKTKVQVTASLTPWTEVTATQDIWF